MKNFVLLILVTASALRAAEGVDPKRAANTVTLDETGAANLGIELAEVEETDFEESVFALGRIQVMPDKRAVVSTRIEGRATSVLVKPDMKCAAGDELLWVESRQFGNPPPVIKVEAPIGGIIVKVNVAVGQPIKPDDALMEIYDLDMVEAVAAVPEHLAGKLTKDMEAHIRAPGFPDKVWDAKLSHIASITDPASGTLEASFHVANEDGFLRPGMKAEFSIVISKREGVMSIPRVALQGDAANRYVFVKDSDPKLKYTYVKSPLVVGQMNDRSVEIVSGLLPGDLVVVRGAYSLAFAGGGSVSLKEALDAAHGHEHNEDGSEMTAEQKAARDAAKGGGDAHGHEEDGGGLFWKVACGVLLVLLVIATLKIRKAEQGKKPEDKVAAKPEPKPETA